MKLPIVKMLEIIGLIAIISALFGLGYQKGLMMSMGFGNTSGSYEIREILNSAVLALFYIFNQLQEISLIDKVMTNWKLIFIYGAVGTTLLLIFSYAHKNPKKEGEKNKNLKNKMLKICDSYKRASCFGFIFGMLGYLTSLFLGYILISALSLLVLPSAAGILIAAHQVDSLKDKKVCVSANEIKSKPKYIHQCTQISINGKKLMGYIVLENKDGYFVHRNDSFLYLSKDGKNCLSSKFVLTESIEHLKSFNFDNKDIEEFCGIKKENKISPLP